MPSIKTRVVNVYVFRLTAKGPEYLALQRRKGIDRLGGTWQAVHGGIEEGETAAQAAVRELREETGLAPTSLWALDVVETFYVYQEDVVVFAPCFGVEAAGDVQLSSEHENYQWLALDGIKKTFIWPGQIKSVEVLHSQIAQKLFEKDPVNHLMKIDSKLYL